MHISHRSEKIKEYIYEALIYRDFDGYCETVTGHELSESFFQANEDWIMNGTKINKWLVKLFFKATDPHHAAKVIERAHRLFIYKEEKEENENDAIPRRKWDGINC